MDWFDYLVSYTMRFLLIFFIGTLMLNSYCITITSASLLYVLCSRENKHRESLALTESERVRLGFEDLTDKENVYFRYVY
jgi:hypothetical protein